MNFILIGDEAQRRFGWKLFTAMRYRPSGEGQYSHTIRVTLLDGAAVVTGQFDGLPVPGEAIAAQLHALLGE